MIAWAQRMVLIKKDMMHDDDDDVGRIYRGTSERQVQESEIPHTHMSCDSLQRSISVRASILSRSIHMDRGETTRSKEGDDIRRPITVR